MDRTNQGSGSNSLNIELHIERLILDGLPVEARSRAELQFAVEAELTRLLLSNGLSPDLLSGGAVRSLGAGEINFTDQTASADLGNSIAQAVHSGIGAQPTGQRLGSFAKSKMTAQLTHQHVMTDGAERHLNVEELVAKAVRRVTPRVSITSSTSGDSAQHLSGSHAVADQRRSGKAKNTLQRKASSQGDPLEVPPIVRDVLRSSGHALDPATRAFFEPRFDSDFSRVRVHTDAKAAESARAVNALAYTVGHHIVLGDSVSNLSTMVGRKTIAHELAHTIQQANNSLDLPIFEVQRPGDASEQEAEAAANSMFDHTQPGSSSISIKSPTTNVTSEATALYRGLSQKHYALQRLAMAKSYRVVTITFGKGMVSNNLASIWMGLQPGNFDQLVEEAWRAVITGAIIKSVVIEGGSTDQDPQSAVLIAQERAKWVWFWMKRYSEGRILKRIRKGEITVALKPSVTNLFALQNLQQAFQNLLKEDKVRVRISGWEN
jgi:hypothetical protein